MEYQVILYPENRSFPEECGFIVYEGNHFEKARGTYRSLTQWIKEQMLPLRVSYISPRGKSL